MISHQANSPQDSDVCLKDGDHKVAVVANVSQNQLNRFTELIQRPKHLRVGGKKRVRGRKKRVRGKGLHLSCKCGSSGT